LRAEILTHQLTLVANEMSPLTRLETQIAFEQQ